MDLSKRRSGLAAVLLALTVVAGCDEAVEPAGDAFQCIGLPSTQCQQMLDEAERAVPGSVPVSALIKCSVRLCTPAKGEASLLVVFANGERIEYGTGWESAGGAAPAPQPVPREEVGPSPAPVEASATPGG